MIEMVLDEPGARERVVSQAETLGKGTHLLEIPHMGVKL
jgi:hypothetical protein